jgi:AraC family transcriptional regulator
MNYRKMVTQPESSSEALSGRYPAEYSPIIPASLLSAGVEATSQNLGWPGLQALRYRNLATNEIQIPSLSQHLLILHTKPAPVMNLRYQDVKREIPPSVGSITVIPPGSVTDCCWRGTKDGLNIHLDPKLVAQVAASSFDLDLSHTAVPSRDALIAPELRSTMLAVDTELRTGGVGGPLIIESLANILAVHLIRHLFGLGRATAATHSAFPRRKLAAVIDYIMANLDARPTVEQMAALVQLSPFHFMRQFKAATGLSPYQFLISRRVELAQHLLRKKRFVSLAEVAIRCGFSDQSQFTFHFKRMVGLTPGQFRAG